MKNLFWVCMVIAVASVFQSCSDSTTSPSSPSTDSFRLVQQNSYDKFGNLKTHWEYLYSNNLLVKVNAYDSTKKLLSYSEYTHNSSNQRTKQTIYSTDGRPNGGYSIYEYNAQGKLSKTSNYSASNLVYSYYTYTFDASGNKVNSTYYSIDSYGVPTLSESTKFLYDDSGKRIRTDSYKPSGITYLHSTNEYADGRLKKVMLYDELNNLTGFRTFDYEAGVSLINQSDFFEF